MSLMICMTFPPHGVLKPAAASSHEHCATSISFRACDLFCVRCTDYALHPCRVFSQIPARRRVVRSRGACINRHVLHQRRSFAVGQQQRLQLRRKHRWVSAAWCPSLIYSRFSCAPHRPPPHTHTHIHTHTHTTQTQTQTQTQTDRHTLSHTHTHTHSLSLARSHSHSDSLTHARFSPSRWFALDEGSLSHKGDVPDDVSASFAM
jgi:hypothetical protein